MAQLDVPNTDNRSYQDLLSHVNQYSRWGSNPAKQSITTHRRWHTLVTVYVRDDRLEIHASPRKRVLFIFGLLPIILLSAVLKGQGGLSALAVFIGFGIGWVFWQIFLLGDTLERVAMLLRTSTGQPSAKE